MKLTDTERIILLNQYDMLERLSSDEYDKNRFKYAQDVVYHGYTKLYSEIFPDLDEEDDHQFVVDVLDMHRDMLYSFKLLESTDIKEDDVKFQGFDGNEEGKYYSFAKFMLEQAGRYRDINEDMESFNSHRNMIGKYTRRLGLWKPLKSAYMHSGATSSKGFSLTEDQLKLIIKA